MNQSPTLLTFSLTYLSCFFPSRTLSWRRKLPLLPSDGQYRYVMSGRVLFCVPLSLALLSSHLKNQSPLTNFMDWSRYGRTSQPVGWGHQLGEVCSSCVGCLDVWDASFGDSWSHNCTCVAVSTDVFHWCFLPIVLLSSQQYTSTLSMACFPRPLLVYQKLPIGPIYHLPFSLILSIGHNGRCDSVNK